MTYAETVARHLERIDLSRARVVLVADALGVSETTLRRRLARDGATFVELKNAERLRRLECGISMRGHDLADLTGHSDRQSFYRWHKSLTGRGYSKQGATFR
jgi:methylphosphotriester-DNA--protein-cysteine methyltransferase